MVDALQCVIKAYHENNQQDKSGAEHSVRIPPAARAWHTHLVEAVEAVRWARISAIVLVDGIGPKGEEALAAAGITTLTQLVAMSAADITALEEKIGKPGVVAKEEWVEQAKEMIGGAEPRSQVDKDLAAKMRKAAAKGEEE